MAGGLGLALLLAGGSASAQDIPWDKTPAKKAPTKKGPPTKAPPKAPPPKAPRATKAPVSAPASPASTPQAVVKPAPPPANEAAPKAWSPGAKSAEAAASSVPPAKMDFEGLLDHFKHQLAPHGAWIEHPSYGSVWVPHEREVSKGFTPYRTDGRWAVTDEGQWAWVSNQDWGRIPFHYGRWVWTKDKSWAWVPGRDHAPAWVVWRLPKPGNNHVGWAPMPPSHVYRDGKKVPLKKGLLAFNYVPARHLFKPSLERHVVTDDRLGRKLTQLSTIFDGNVTKGKKGLAPVVPATPDFDDARVPEFAVPKTRLPGDAEPIKPIVLAMLKTVSVPGEQASSEDPKSEGSGPETSRFASPPNDAAPTGPRDGADPPAGSTEASDDEPRYRCWWTNTRPRIWRCGY